MKLFSIIFYKIELQLKIISIEMIVIVIEIVSTMT